ncbi:MAG TPA: hypothetical protein VKP66_20045 [Steroidobacteraceae bacterium]|nr:hypothetical protein [Steroidobacteraceae bacterium]
MTQRALLPEIAGYRSVTQREALPEIEPERVALDDQLDAFTQPGTAA